MPNNNIEEEIREIIAEIIEKKPQEITPDANLVEDLGADSMMALELLASLEKKYKIIIPEDNLMKLKSLNATVKIVTSFLKKK